MKKIIFTVLIICLFFTSGCSEQKLKSKTHNCELVIDYSNGVIIGSVKYLYYLPANNLKSVVFNLYPNSFEGYEENYKINGVSVEKSDCKWEYAGDKNEFLVISIPENKKSGEAVDIFIEFECSLIQSDQKLGITNEVVNLAFFYPIVCAFENENYLMQSYLTFGNPFCFEFCNYDIYLTIPSVYTFSSGATVKSVEVLGDKTTYFEKKKSLFSWFKKK